MRIDDEVLLDAGFSAKELQKLKNNIANYGGTLDSATSDLANRFVIASCVVLFCIATFILLLIFGSEENIFAGAVGLLCGILVAIFVQPPLLAFKSWRYKRALHRH